jgi:uncharacterized protein (UPF0332 family)
VKPETAAYLLKSREFLIKARSMLENAWPDEAGRAAYPAGFHAAQAWIFEAAERTPKSHSGVHSEFSRLVKDDRRFSMDHRRFLGRTYDLKAAADYATGPQAQVTIAQANDAIFMADRFVKTIELQITAGGALPMLHQKRRCTAGIKTGPQKAAHSRRSGLEFFAGRRRPDP